MSQEWQEASNEYALVRLLSAAMELILLVFFSGILLHPCSVELGPGFANIFLHLQSEKMNPIHGISKPGYEGKGFVQSPPAEKS